MSNNVVGFLRQKLDLYSKNPLLKYLLVPYNKYVKYPMQKPLWHKFIMLAITYQCQCRCVHCSASSYTQSKRKELESSEVMRLIDEFSRLDALGVYFFGGEPLLVPELNDYVRYAKEKGLMTIFDTNGLLLDENKVKSLKDAGIYRIGVSIDSPFEDVHDRLRGVKGAFKKAVAGIRYCKKYGVDCYVSTYATKDNLNNGELEGTINLAKRLGVKTRIMSLISSGGGLDRNEMLLSAEDRLLLKGLLEKDSVYWEFDNPIDPSLSFDSKEVQFSCASFERWFFYISAYGDVQPCCYMPISFGNVREEPLETILRRMWNSDMFVNYKGCNDCLMNEKNFRDKYSKLIESQGQYPKRFVI